MVTQMGTTIEKEIFRLKAYTTKEMAELYDVTPKTFRTMIKPFLEEIGKRSGWYFNVNQVMTILKKCGIPKNLNLDGNSL
jgi:hypothetical protein